MQQYIDSLRTILEYGHTREDRTGIGTIGIFGMQMRFDLQEGFPAVTTKRLAWKSVVSELLWFLEGSEDERRLAEIHYGKPRSELKNKKTIWTANADKQGVDLGYYNTELKKLLGPVYGVQWRNWGGVDQISKLINDLREDPYSRRHVLSAWNVPEIEQMALPPCHSFSQFYVVNGKLSSQLYQRSADMFLGVPFNIASYSLLTHILADLTGLEVGEFIWTGGDCHIYTNHTSQVNEQISREPSRHPHLVYQKQKSLDDYLKLSPTDFILENYSPMPSIKAPMAI